jgi:anthranilate phosphoribosyltransferase
MNLIGPLVNPAGLVRQVIGVSEGSKAPLVAEALRVLGARHALVLHAHVGMDEISPSGSTTVWEISNGEVDTWEVDPAKFGLACNELDALSGGEPFENAGRIERLFSGDGEPAVRCAVLLNAAAALFVSDNGWSFEEAIDRGRESLDTGAAAAVLAGMRVAAPRS